jgi:hypothetical protein
LRVCDDDDDDDEREKEGQERETSAVGEFSLNNDTPSLGGVCKGEKNKEK